MNRVQSKRRYLPDHAGDEGPFVSFTDLFIGILFLFLILVAALMLMHQEAVQQVKREEESYAGMSPELVQELRDQNIQMKAELAEVHSKDAEHPPFRLAMVYNSYQLESATNSGFSSIFGNSQVTEWKFVETVQVFRSSNGLCITNVSLADTATFRVVEHAVRNEDIPTADNQKAVTRVASCLLTADGEHTENENQKVDLTRTSEELYEGNWISKADGVTHGIQYRVLGIYDETYRQQGSGGGTQ